MVPLGSVPLQELFDARATMNVLVQRNPAVPTYLKIVTIGNLRRRPSILAVDYEDHSARLQTLFDEASICSRKVQELESEVGHLDGHVPVLGRIVHLMQLQVGIAVEHGPSERFSPLSILGHIVGLNRLIAVYKHEISLREPRNA